MRGDSHQKKAKTHPCAIAVRGIDFFWCRRPDNASSNGMSAKTPELNSNHRARKRDRVDEDAETLVAEGDEKRWDTEIMRRKNGEGTFAVLR